MSGDITESAGRAASISSSSADTATHEDNDKLARIDPIESSSLEELKRPEELEIGDEEEGDVLLPQHDDEKPEPPKSSFTSSLIWMVVNTLATIGIVRCSPRLPSLTTETSGH
jgi:solute carrier family 35 protein E3